MKEFLTRNLKVKILAVLLSLLAWIYVQSFPSFIFDPVLGLRERRINLTVQYQNLQPDLVLVEGTEQIEIGIREPFGGLTQDQPIRAVVDLSQIEAGGRYFLEIDVEMPGQMQVLYQRPVYALILVEEVN